MPRTLLRSQQIYVCSTLPGKGREHETGPGMEVEAAARIVTSACSSLRGDWEREKSAAQLKHSARSRKAFDLGGSQRDYLST